MENDTVISLNEIPCPDCGKLLHPPLKSGRQVCTKCSWASAGVKSLPPTSKPAYSIGTKDVKSYLTSLVVKAKNIDRKVIIGCGLGLGITVTSAVVLLLADNHQSNICKSETKEIDGKIIEEWKDAMSLAENTSRMNIGISISSLQSIKRKTNEAKYPQCALLLKTALLEGMKSDIRQLTAFAGGSKGSVHKAYSWEIHDLEKSILLSKGKSKKIDSVEEANRVIYESHKNRLELMYKKIEGVKTENGDQLDYLMEISRLSVDSSMLKSD
jgi:hypothetical protein